MNQCILVTGAAGFIGFHLCKKLLSNRIKVIGLDNINDYYDTNLKEKRLEIISEEITNKNIFWKFIKADLVNKEEISEVFEQYKPQIVVNLAAQAGVRNSIINPDSYIRSNIVGFLNLLECCRSYKIKNLLYASSSSVYGGNKKIPYSEIDSVNHPVSLYAATKRSNELMAHTYCHLYNMNAIGMRFFTVYGPWGRPDMAPMKFTKNILSKETISIFNHGNMSRSFTYIDDIVDIICKLINKPATPDHNFNGNKPNPSTSWASHRIFNLGNENSIKLLDFIQLLEDELGMKSLKEYEKMQLGDVQFTSSDCSSLKEWIGPYDFTSIETGIKKFINWYKDFYKY
tara:strand:+ start:535 stop:1563 length:1029 start_codon:yes stop_codon:yes gene_type:complete